MAPTVRQLALLRYVHGYHLAHGGVSPSYQRCAADLGLASKSGIHRLLHGLQMRGLVCLRPGHPCSIEILQPPSIPTFAGAPLYAVPLRMPEA
ncbi:hypothetical protein [Novosphingobium guangzhouense]|uniref:LexA repressor DNA-binding domain-containing protein n=1 Tax=Novosphingobium guangzhouense TaxID=1850347 RepID=A0A2K2G5Y8_9SPHN|nr:hypothetical protein [Novosphingobium guangzhouense]PNU06451.1 hypothetical protein A8V01_02590 [Novosphingobium guangzhouense]